MSYKLLETIKSPDDVKKLGEKDIPVLCEEIREFLIDNICRFLHFFIFK